MGGSGFFGCSRVETREMWMLPRDVTESFPFVRRRSARCSLMLCLLAFEQMVGLVGVETKFG